MAASRKPKTAPSTPWPTEPGTLHMNGSWIWLPLKNEWRDSTGKPEELVRQKFVRHLCENYGYSLDQMRQEQRMISGSRSARADIVIWETAAKANAGPGVSPVLVVECKAESVEINLRDYYQGESYTRSAACEFFITTNNRFTAIFKLVPGAPGDFVQINEIPKASDWGDAKRLEEIRSKLRVFQSQGVPRPSVQVPLDPARCAQDGPRPRIRHDLEDPLREDVRRAIRAARNFYCRFPRPPRIDSPAHRPGGA